MTDIEIKQNTEPSRVEKSEARRRWRDSHLVLFVLPVVLTILYPGRAILYLHGRFRPYAGTRAAVIWLLPVAGVFMIWCFVWGIVRLVSRRKDRTRNEVLVIAAETCIPLVCVGLFIASFHFAQPYRGNELFMFGLRDRVKNRADVAATRDWLQSLAPEEYEVWDGKLNARPPELLTGLKNANTSLSADENGNPRIRLTWGSGVMGHWGAVIGMKDMETPPSDFRHYGYYRLPVEPGVYVWLRFE